MTIRHCTDEILLEHLVQGMDLQDIQVKYGYGYKYIRSRCFSLGYKFAPKRRPQIGDSIDLELLKQYIAADYGVTELCQHFQIKRGVLRNLLNQLELTVSNCDRKTKLLRQYVITPLQRSIITGTLLGDSSLVPGKSYSQLTFTHCIAQSAYAQWKAEQLYPLMDPTRKRQIQHKNVFGSEESRQYVGYYSYGHTTLLALRQQWYPNGKKIVPVDVAEILDPLSLAVWYMDDGSIATNTSSLYTQGFTVAEVELLISIIYKKFGISCELELQYKKHYNPNKIYPIIKIKRAESTKFHKLIDPFIHDCLYYKRTTIPTLTEDQLQSAISEGLTDEEISTKYSVKKYTVERDRRIYGITRYGLLHTYTKDQILQLLQTHGTRYALAKYLGVSTSALRTFCRKNNIVK